MRSEIWEDRLFFSRIKKPYLIIKDLKTPDGKPLRGFEILDHKGYFVKAEAFIKGDQVIIAVPEDKRVDKIVYGWQPFTTANLVNEEGLPASTFMINIFYKEMAMK